MHIPDGFIAPGVYVPAYAMSLGFWAYALRRIGRILDERSLPVLAVTTALVFVFMMIPVPVPGGTSVHATGIGLLAVLFGVWITFLAVSIVLLLQTTLLGMGGITSLPVNALAMGLVGGAVGVAAFRALRRSHETAALFTAGWASVNAAALILAVVLGLQPDIAQMDDGTPLFFPFDLTLTIPAVMIPHALLGVGEGILTVLVYRIITSVRRGDES